jgi:hypothetical protein
MKKLLVALSAAAFALGSAVAFADDKSPAQPADQAKMKADRDAAKAADSNMTPEEKAAAKKAKRAKKHKELSQIEKSGNPNAMGKAEATAKSAEATKNDPKAIQTTEERQKALKTQSSDPPGHYPTAPATK